MLSPLARHSQFRIPHSALAPLVLVALLFTGCTRGYIDEWTYGSRSGSGVNGVAVLGEMYENAGHRVRSSRSLHPRVGEADVIVWFCDDWNAPSAEAQIWLDDWLLYNDSGKTLIYVSRDYAAGEYYWTAAKPKAPASQQIEYAKNARESRSMFNSWRGMAPKTDEADDWFSLDRRNTQTRVAKLSGPWSEGVDAKKTALEHRSYLTPNALADPLLTDGARHPLASEIVYEPEEWNWRAEDSRLILIENGAFLLNASLVNKEHRKLAGKLVAHTGPPQLDVVFLEAGSDVPVLDSDPADGPPTMFRLFTVWPIGASLTQLAALGLIFAASVWPIFGRPRRGERVALTDFGRHVAAVGRLLAATRDRAYAYAQLRAYFQAGDD